MRIKLNKISNQASTRMRNKNTAVTIMKRAKIVEKLANLLYIAISARISSEN